MQDTISSLTVRIVSQDQMVYGGKVLSLVAPAQEGYVGILRNHAPFVTPLTAGKITVRDVDGKTTSFHNTGRGILEVYHNTATILLDSIKL
jgi:F-type H+-transporting ATPase subunit epsilon